MYQLSNSKPNHDHPVNPISNGEFFKFVKKIIFKNIFQNFKPRLLRSERTELTVYRF